LQQHLHDAHNVTDAKRPCHLKHTYVTEANILK